MKYLCVKLYIIPIILFLNIFIFGIIKTLSTNNTNSIAKTHLASRTQNINNNNIFKNLNYSSNSIYEISSFILSSNLPFTNYTTSEVNYTFPYKVNDTEFDFEDNIQEKNQRFNTKILKLIDKDTEKEYTRVNMIENFASTNQFYKNEKNAKNANLGIFDFNEVKCTINYPGLAFNFTKEKQSSSGSSSGFRKTKIYKEINFVLKNDRKGIFVYKFFNGILVNETLLGILINDEDKDLNLDEIYFEDFYVTEKNEEGKNYLILIENKSKNIYLIQINDIEISTKKENFINFDFSLLNVFDREQFYSIHLDKILAFNVLKGNYFLIAVNEETDKSLNIASYSSKIETIRKLKYFDSDINNEIALDIIAVNFRENNYYLAIRNFGLVSYKIKEEKFEIIFKHQKIEGFILSDLNNNYIGVLLNNDYIKENNNDSREFYIELNKNSDSFSYEINKIFYSTQDSNDKFYDKNNYIHDSLSDYLFFFSKENNIIYYVKINLPNLYDNIDGKFLIKNMLKDFNFEGFKMIDNKNQTNNRNKTNTNTNSSAYDKRNLLILQGKLNQEKIFFYNFRLNKKANYNCKIKNSGNFTVINSFINYDEEEKVYKRIKNIKKIQILLNSQEEGLSAFWIIGILFVLLGVIAGLIFYFYNKKKKQNSSLIYNFAQLEEL